MKSFVALALSLLSSQVFGATPSAPAAPALPTEVRTALNSPQDLKCQGAYSRLFAKGSTNIRVVFGYKDTRPARFVGDRHERLAFVQRILRPCGAGEFACGFSRDSDNADMFFKTVASPTPGHPMKVNLFVANSSVGSDDALNREDAFQKWKSVYAKKAFYEGITKADVVLYNGHSRFGGGPDFEPPKLLAGGDVDSSAYTKDRHGLQLTRQRLRQRSRESEKPSDNLKLLGLFSCASSQHFTNEVLQDSSTGFVSSRSLIYYADALENSLHTVSALLEMRCEKDFRSAIFHGSPVKGAQLDGFFSRD